MDAVIFSDVTLNTGNAYNATTGEFTAPSRDTTPLHGPLQQMEERCLVHSLSSMVNL